MDSNNASTVVGTVDGTTRRFRHVRESKVRSRIRRGESGLPARFVCRYPLLNDPLRPKSASPPPGCPFAPDRVIGAIRRDVGFSGWSRTYAVTTSPFALGVPGSMGPMLAWFRFVATAFPQVTLIEAAPGHRPVPVVHAGASPNHPGDGRDRAASVLRSVHGLSASGPFTIRVRWVRPSAYPGLGIIPVRSKQMPPHSGQRRTSAIAPSRDEGSYRISSSGM